MNPQEAKCATASPCAPSRPTANEVLRYKAKALRDEAHALEKLADRLPPLNDQDADTLEGIVRLGLNYAHPRSF